MAKRGKNQKSGNINPKKMKFNEDVIEDMNDDIDAFHLQRDKVPLDLNIDPGDSDEDEEHPVFDYKGIESDDDDDEDDDDDDDVKLGGLAAKIVRTQRFLKGKFGDVEDDAEDDIEDDEGKKNLWGKSKHIYYDADNVDNESSDEESLAEEEAEVMRLQKERAKSLSMLDFGIEGVEKDDSDGEPTLEEMAIKGKDTARPPGNRDTKEDVGMNYEVVKKDLSALSKDELMDIVSSSAPELVGLLGELKDALKELENKVDPLLSQVHKANMKKVGMNYLEVKRILLLTYCQAITFYLLVKSEGEPVKDHPVIARLVEIKSLLDKMKELDANLPSGVVELFSRSDEVAAAAASAIENTALLPNPSPEGNDLTMSFAENQEVPKSVEAAEPVKGKKLKNNVRHNEQVSMESVKMLKTREALEEKLKQKGIFISTQRQSSVVKGHKLKLLNRQLETFDDFDDDAMDVEGTASGLSGRKILGLSKELSQFTNAATNKSKAVSGDDDLPKRDNLGERRRKHELRVLAGAGIESLDDEIEDDKPGNSDGSEDADVGGGETGESEDEFYKQARQARAEKLAAKSEKYSRVLSIPSEPQTIVDGKRQITTQMEKNRGLTRSRKKLIKNPRKKYKLKHKKALKRRAGQVRVFNKPSGSYGGEASGINTVSHSRRFV
ncbi:hypothetical protein Ancab_012765 [Ancistrocladus abbreviatus]